MSPHPPESSGSFADLSARAAISQQFWNNSVLPLLEQLAERQLRGERDDITLEAGDAVAAGSVLDTGGRQITLQAAGDIGVSSIVAGAAGVVLSSSGGTIAEVGVTG